MKILFIGDSITRGTNGHSFVKLLADRFPGQQLINHGMPGDTIAGICRRLIAGVKSGINYDAIVIQAGYNDLLLPLFLNRNELFGFAYRRQQKKGIYHLARAQDISTCFGECIRKVRQYSPAKIIICTLGAISENPDPGISSQRNLVNQSIRALTGFRDVFIADVALATDTFLAERITNSYCVENFWSLVLFDRLIATLPGGSNFLSRKRKLWLTTDGIHLNNTGAAIFAEVVAHTLLCRVPALQDLESRVSY